MRTYILLMIFNPQKKHLLGVKRSKKDSSFGGMWSLPGGGVNQEETLDQAATRELKEETGLEIDQILPGNFLEFSPTLKGITIKMVIKLATVYPGKPIPQDSEVEKVAWITPEKLLASLKAFNVPHEALKKFQTKLAAMKKPATN